MKTNRISILFVVFLIMTFALAFMAMGCGKASLVFSPNLLPQAALGQPYQTIVKISENSTPVGSMTIDSGTLPSGLTLQFNKGTDSALISGTPSQSGSFKFTLGAWCMGTNSPGQSGSQVYVLIVN